MAAVTSPDSSSCWQTFQIKVKDGFYGAKERFSGNFFFETSREIAGKISLVALASLACCTLDIPCWWAGLGMCGAIVVTRITIVIIDKINPKILLQVKNKMAKVRRCFIWLYRALFLAALAGSFLHPAIGVALGIVCGIITECVYDRKVSIDQSKDEAAEREQENKHKYELLANNLPVETIDTAEAPII